MQVRTVSKSRLVSSLYNTVRAVSSDVNKDWIRKYKDKDKDQAYKDQEKHKDFTYDGYKDLQLKLELQSRNDNEDAQQTTVMQD